MRFVLQNTDAVEYLSSIPDNSIDLVITDPPYESLEKHRKKGTTTRLKNSKSSSNVWFDIFHNHRFPEFLECIYRVLRNNSHFYLFCDSQTMFTVKPMAEEVGFKFWKPLVWNKEIFGLGYHYRAMYEFILFFEKGKRRLYDLAIPDILTAKRIKGGFPAEKPYSLLEILVKQSSREGELVLDPFCGSGSTGEAAIRNHRNFYGNDLWSDAVEMTRNRLQAIGGEEVDKFS